MGQSICRPGYNSREGIFLIRSKLNIKLVTVNYLPSNKTNWPQLCNQHFLTIKLPFVSMQLMSALESTTLVSPPHLEQSSQPSQLLLDAVQVGQLIFARARSGARRQLASHTEHMTSTWILIPTASPAPSASRPTISHMGLTWAALLERYLPQLF